MNAYSSSMELLTEKERRQLVKNFRQRLAGKITDPKEFIPVVHFQTADGMNSWMITELSDQDNDAAYGLFTDYNVAARIGPISLREMVQTADKTGIGVLKVQPFNPPYELAIYEKIQGILAENDE
jgi:hypothetical protein